MDMTSWTHGTLYWFGILYGQDDTHNWFLRIANNVKKKKRVILLGVMEAIYIINDVTICLTEIKLIILGF